MIRLVNNIYDASYITHSGTMHADEVFATAFLELYKKDIDLFRTPEVPSDISSDCIIYDIGRGKFDHHQEDRKVRENGIPYCAFGLLFEEYGKDFLKQIGIENIDEVFLGIDKDLVEGIDAIDNGIFPKIEAVYKIRTVSDIIKLFNPAYGSLEEENTQFLKAVEVARAILLEEITYINGKVLAKREVEKKIEEACKKHYLLLDEYMPYEESIYQKDVNKEIYFVVYPSNRGGYAAKIINNSADDRTARLEFPKEWAGLGEELAQLTKVSDATFCHLSRFIVCAKSKEGIIKLVELAIENKKEKEVPNV